MAHSIGNLEYALQILMKSLSDHSKTSSTLDLIPFTTLYKLDDVTKALIRHTYGKDSLEPKPGMVQYWVRGPRLPRLMEGSLKVYIPQQKTRLDGVTISVPEATVQVEHRRTYHRNASSDLKLLEKEFPADRYGASVSEDPRTVGFLENIVNMEITSGNNSTVHSVFKVSLPEPRAWESLVQNATSVAMYMGLDPNDPLSRMLREDMPDKNLADVSDGIGIIHLAFDPNGGIIIQDGREFTERFDKDKHLENFSIEVNLQRAYVALAIKRIMEEYAGLTQDEPLVFSNNQVNILGFDGKGKLLTKAEIGDDRGIPVDRPLTLSDLAKGYSTIERQPFNEKFHQRLQDSLIRRPTRRTPYEIKARSTLSVAFSELLNSQYESAIKTAGTAFEIAL